MSNLRLWERYGASLLVVQPFMDSVIVRGDGCYLIDADGRRILDLAAGQFCSVLGHNHPKFVERLQRQLPEIIHLGDQYVSPSVLRAAARLAEVTPGDLNKVLFLSTGSEANECAMRIAKAVTGRTGTLAFTRGYYGISLATRNLSSISDYPGKVDFRPVPADQHKLITPDCRRCPLSLEPKTCEVRCLDVSLELIGSNASNIAAVMVEPVLSAGGMIFPSRDYLTELRDRTRRMGALFVVDEAQTGFGRCGRWFDIEHHGIQPDILVLSKTAGNGFPAAAVVVSEAIAATLEGQRFTHLSSHQNDPLGAAAVEAVIDLVAEEGLVERARAMGEYFMERLEGLRQRYPIVSDVRGRGLMIGVELDGRAAPTAPSDLALRVALLCERDGLHVTFSYYEPVIRIIPPLIISRPEIDVAVQILDRALASVTAGNEPSEDLLPKNPRSGPFVRPWSYWSSPGRLMDKLWTTPPREWLAKARKAYQGR